MNNFALKTLISFASFVTFLHFTVGECNANPTSTLLFEFGSSSLTSVTGIAINSYSEVIVTESTRKIHIFDACGNLLRSFSTPNSLLLVAIGLDDTIYVGDSSKFVRAYNRMGQFLFSWNPTLNTSIPIQTIPGLAVGPDGSIYTLLFGAAGEAVIARFDPCGNLLSSFEFAESPLPSAIATNQDGQVVVILQTEDPYIVRVFTENLMPIFGFSQPLIRPLAVTISESGDIIILDFSSQVYVYDNCGNLVNYFSSINNSKGLVINLDGILYVAASNRVQVYTFN